ncbi:SNF2 domain containing protein [Klebsormidium nitens]|uniref:SNF2 domain containing protein n=1 Tax=Klebsormidium nitens TaxID=105231 RepID=A0A1Y1HPT5_KLENI|nr:SNF2 domain containing protein [Klebsormidium nitens]|eukprot:GAQ77838.1 SNF2 domain containing protein [Klebsormidium nitens]
MLPHVADATLKRHLKAAKGSVDRAADAYFGAQLDATSQQPALGETAKGFQSRAMCGVEGAAGSHISKATENGTSSSKQSPQNAAVEARQAAVPLAARSSAGGPLTASTIGQDTPGPSNAVSLVELSEAEQEEAPRRRPKRKRVATVPFSPDKPDESTPKKKVHKPLQPLVTSASSGETFVIQRGDGRRYPLPLKEHRNGYGRLFAAYETELPNLVPPPKKLDFTFPGVHLGSFCINLTPDAAKSINANSGFVEVAWSELSWLKQMVLIDGDGNPQGLFQKEESDDTMVVHLSLEAKQGGGFAPNVEEATYLAHRDGLVRLFATLDNCGDAKKNGTKRFPNEAMSRLSAFTRGNHRATRGPAVFVHVCLTEKACRYNFPDGGFEERKNGKMAGNRRLLPIAMALRYYGFGLEHGPDSDELLNFGPDVPPPEAVSEQHFDLFNLLASIDLPESAPAALTPPQLLTQPMEYQRKALSWMMTREGALGGSNVRRNILTLHPCWQQLLTVDGQVLYMQREDGACSQNFYTAPHQGTCGGLLCDEMGLGKTLEMLMLVLANPPPPGWAVVDASTWDHRDDVMPIKATLVVVPASLLNQWKREVELHVRPGALKVLHYEGRHRRGAGVGKRAAVNWGLEQYDIVITSYEVIRTELAGSADSPLLSYGFWRVVLDEAQLVANSSSVAAVTASSIMRRHAWVVTGTPITSRLDELQGLLDFLAVQPFGDPTVFRSMLKIPYETRTAVGLQRLRVLLKTIMIRRTKAGVAAEMVLPPCTRVDSILRFSDAETSYYQRVHEGFVAAIKRMERHHATRDVRRLEGFDPSNLGAKVTGQALANLTRLRQACCHPQIIRTGNEYLGKARLTMTQIMAKLAVAIGKQKETAAANIFEPLLADLARCGALALERAGQIKAPVDGDLEAERATRQAAAKASYERLELTALTAYSQLLEKDVMVGEEVGERARSVGDRVTELEDELGITAERIAAAEAGRKLTRAEQKKQKWVTEQESTLWRSAGWQRARGEAGEWTSGAGPSTSAPAEAFTGRLTRRGKRKLEELAGGSDADADRTGVETSKLSEYDREIADILEGPQVTRKGKKKHVRTAEQRVGAAAAAVDRAKERMEDLFRQEKHLDFKLDEMEKGKGKLDSNGASTSDAATNGDFANGALPSGFLVTEQTVVQEDKTQCPICLDSCEDCGAVTVCGHYFCSDCIHGYIQSKGADAPCPLCRHKLKTKDVFNACKEAEKKQGDLPDLSGEYGTKVSALISELIDLRNTDPTAKSVIFSSWRLLLNLAGEALAHNGFQYSLLWGRPEERVQALRDFNENPNVRAILVMMGNSGGAAGLTLTAASTAFILEPSVNPGMEAQAAARIHRLSQDRPTRVVRFIVDKTIEPKIVKLQGKKLEMGSSGGGGIVIEQLRGQDLLELIDDDTKGKQQVE